MEAKRQWKIASKNPANLCPSVKYSSSSKALLPVFCSQKAKYSENSEGEAKRGKYEVQETRLPTQEKAEEMPWLTVKRPREKINEKKKDA